MQFSALGWNTAPLILTAYIKQVWAFKGKQINLRLEWGRTERRWDIFYEKMNRSGRRSSDCNIYGVKEVFCHWLSANTGENRPPKSMKSLFREKSI